MLAKLDIISPGFLALGAVILYISYKIVAALLDPLRSIPGPFLARFTRLWLAYQIWKGEFQLVNIALHKKYGSLVRIAPGNYSVDDVDGARVIYAHGAGFTKGTWYTAWTPNQDHPSLFADLNNKRHGTQRRKFAAAYSMSTLVTYEPYVNNCTALLSQRLNELAAQKLSSPIFNLGHWLQCYTFDVIGEITFGKRFGFLDMGIDSGVFKAIDQRGLYSTFIGLFPWLHPFLYPLLPSSVGHGYVGNYTVGCMEERQKELKDPSLSLGRQGPVDFLTRFLGVHQKDPDKMTKTDLFTICQSNIGAGSDTTAITLSGAFYYMLKNPATLQRLRDEVDAAYLSGLLSDSEFITFKDAQKLKYLQAVVKEALRLNSVTGLPMQRTVPASGVSFSGKHFPAGTTLGINAWVAHRNKSVYGGDAELWRPERWLEYEEQGRNGEIEKYFFAFGMGSRTCIGKNISLLEIQKLIPTLIRNFDFELAPQLKPEGATWTSWNRWFVKQYDFEATVKVRDREAENEKQ